MVRYAQMVLKIGFHSLVGPTSSVEFGNLDSRNFSWPNIQALIGIKRMVLMLLYYIVLFIFGISSLSFNAS